MEVGVLTVALDEESLDGAIEHRSDLGVSAVGLGCGRVVRGEHLSMGERPDDERAELAAREIRETVRLADRSGADTVNGFWELSARGPSGEVPNWTAALREGLEKAVDVPQRAAFETQPGDAYRA